MKKGTILSIVIFFMLCSCKNDSQNENYLAEGFQNPPLEARPCVWWHWIDGHISEEGITRDIQAMAEQGIGGATILNVGISSGDFHDHKPVYDYMTDDWKALVTHAFREAEKYGLKLSIHNCDGWSHTGGTWVTPQQGMKKVTFSKSIVKGGQKVQLKLPEPPDIIDFYKDVAVMAYPYTSALENSMYTRKYKIASNVKSENPEHAADANIISYAKFYTPDNEDDFIELILTFEEPFSVTAVAISDYYSNQSQLPAKYRLQYSVDGQNFITIKDIVVKSPRNEGVFNAVTAKYFKLIMLEPPKKGFEKEYVTFHEIELLSNNARPTISKIHDFGKKSSNWIRRRDYLPMQAVNGKWEIDKKAVIDISDYMDEDGMLNWQAPEGNWEVIRMGYTATGRTNSPATDAGRGLECDKMNAQHVEDFFNNGPKILVEENEEFVGNSFTHFLTDSWEAYCANWTENFPEEFEKRRGYSIFPYLPVLCDEIVGSVDVSERFLWDFRRTIADLYKENCYAKFQELCSENGLNFQAEASGAQQNMMDPITYPGVVDKPMTEFWIAHDDPHSPMRINGDVMGAISASHIYDKKVVAAEAFTAGRGNWSHAPYNLKKAGDAAFALGINMVYFHDYAHQPDETYPGWQMVPWGIAMNRKLTWWNMASGYFDYLSRCQYLLQEGNFVADVLAFHGEGAGTTTYFAYQEESVRTTGRSNAKEVLMDVARNIAPEGYAWDGCNTETLMERIKVENGRLVLPHGQSYRLLRLPNRNQMTPELLKRIKELVEDGAIVYGPPPANSPSLSNYPDCDKEVKKLVSELWGNINSNATENHLGKGTVYWGLSIQEVMDRLKIEPDFEYAALSEGEHDFMYNHRKNGKADIYFISNQTGNDELIECSFRIGNKIPETWDPSTGEIQECNNYQFIDNHTKIKMQFPPYGSIFIIFREKGTKSKLQEEDKIAAKTLTMNEDWELFFPEGWGAPDKIHLSSLSSWHENPNDGIKYFSGIATYKKKFSLDNGFLEKDCSYQIDLGKIHEVGEVQLNGINLGVLWKPPYSFDISSALNENENEIVIKVANHWTNRLIGDELSHTGKRFTKPITRMHYDEKGEQVLQPSGLIGPVTIKKFEN